MTFKPVLLASPAWMPQPSVKLDWVEALRPRRLGTIGVALEHNQADAESSTAPRPEPRAPERAGLAPRGRYAAHPSSWLRDRRPRIRSRRALPGRSGRRAERSRVHGRAGLAARPGPRGEIVSYLRQDPVDLLVVGSHGHGLVRDLLLGQTVDKVRHSLDVPMLIARPDRAVAVTAHVDDAISPAPRVNASEAGRHLRMFRLPRLEGCASVSIVVETWQARRAQSRTKKPTVDPRGENLL